MVPFTLIAVVETNPVPVTVTTGDAAPSSSLLGDTDDIVGEGLFTVRLMGVPDALFSDPFTTTTANWPALANCVAGTTAVTCELLTYVVAAAVPATWTALELRNPEPDTVKVSAAEPARTLVGLMDEIAGVGVVVPLLPDDVEPEPPPHAPISIEIQQRYSECKNARGFHGREYNRQAGVGTVRTETNEPDPRKKLYRCHVNLFPQLNLV
jgi:hypothetical protein